MKENTKIEFIFVSGNKNKVKEVKNALPDAIIHTPDEYGITIDGPETENTYSRNAYFKVMEFHKKFREKYTIPPIIPIVASDCGFEVEELEGAPGIYTGRILRKSDDASTFIQYMMKNCKNRNARYVAHLFILWNFNFRDASGQTLPTDISSDTTGTVILTEPRGNSYCVDPVFVPDCVLPSTNEVNTKTLAEFTDEERAEFHYLAKAIKQFAKWYYTYKEYKDAKDSDTFYRVYQATIKNHYNGEVFIGAGNAEEAMAFVKSFKESDPNNERNSWGLEDAISENDYIGLYSKNKGIVYDTLNYIG